MFISQLTHEKIVSSFGEKEKKAKAGYKKRGRQRTRGETHKEVETDILTEGNQERSYSSFMVLTAQLPNA